MGCRRARHIQQPQRRSARVCLRRDPGLVNGSPLLRGPAPVRLPPAPARILRSHVALTPGSRLGVDDIAAQIGVGGMGEVYRAADSNLKRSVAIKVLPASVAGDADRVAFSANPKSSRPSTIRTSERLRAQENTGLDGAPEGTGLGGEDLSQRIAPGAISVDDALPVAKQIAEAPEASPIAPAA